jgi:Na+/melibiose symporter-like transporter
MFLITTIIIAMFIATAILIASMIADVAEEGQLSHGRRSEGLLFAANSFIQKFTSGIGIYSASVILDLIGFPEDAQPGHVDPTVLQNLALVYVSVLVPLFIAAIALVSTYRIDRQTHEANLARLADAGAGATPQPVPVARPPGAPPGQAAEVRP